MLMRVAVVTAGLMAAGAVFGTVAGALVLGAWLVNDPGLFEWDGLVFVMQAAAVFGGVPGAVLGPVAAWLLMRHVPLGLAVGGTTLGTLATGGIAAIVTGDPVLGLFWGMAGFGVSALGLWLGVPRDRRLLRG